MTTASHAGANTSWSPLQLDPWAQSAALSEAISASPSLEARRVNPASVTSDSTWEVGLSVGSFFGGQTLEEVSLSTRLGAHTLGFAAGQHSIGDIEVRGDAPSYDPLAIANARTQWATASYAFDLFRQLTVGASAQFAYERIVTESASATVVDLGLLARPTDWLRVGVALDGLGSSSMLGDFAPTLPSAIRVGVHSTLPFLPDGWRASLEADGRVLERQRLFGALGAEVVWHDIISARLGYGQLHTLSGWSGGLGVQWKQFTLDYALAPYREGMGAAHRVSIGARWR